MRLELNLPFQARSSPSLRKDDKSRTLNLSELAIPADAVQPPPQQAQDRGDEQPRSSGLNIVV
jgi:hypothetical protein